MRKQIAIIGSGPAGFYIADVLSKQLPDSRIDLLERLPTPYGLVRAGVAPDHQGTKNIARQFDRILQRDNVRWLGNVEVGRDLSYAELKAIYDLVVLTIGAQQDRKLGIPGETLAGVYGSAAFVGWYNGHPDQRTLAPKLDGRRIAIIGNGNVALDIARILAKSPAELAASDLCQQAQQPLSQAPIEDIYLLGRRGPAEASFTPAELNEFAQLERCVPLVDAAQLPNAIEAKLEPRERRNKQKNLELLRRYSQNHPDDKPLRLHFMFYVTPREILGATRVRALRLERNRPQAGRIVATGTTFELPVDCVITAIGYRTRPFAGLPFDEARGIVANREGWVEPGVYAAGWCKRGPQGVIPANRSDSLAVAKRILHDLASQPDDNPKSNPDTIDRLLAERHVRTVTYADWERLKAAEEARAEGAKPREKFTSVEAMLAFLES